MNSFGQYSNLPKVNAVNWWSHVTYRAHAWHDNDEFLQTEFMTCTLTQQAIDTARRVLDKKYQICLGVVIREGTWLISADPGEKPVLLEYSFPFPEDIDLTRREHWFCKVQKNHWPRTVAASAAVTRQLAVTGRWFGGSTLCTSAPQSPPKQVPRTPDGWSDSIGKSTGKTLSQAIIDAELDLGLQLAHIEA